MCRLMSFIKFEKLLTIIFSDILFAPFSPVWDLYYAYVGILDGILQVSEDPLVVFILAFYVHQTGQSQFKPTNFSFCWFRTDIRPLWWFYGVLYSKISILFYFIICLFIGILNIYWNIVFSKPSLLLGSILNDSLYNHKNRNNEMKITKICDNYLTRWDVKSINVHNCNLTNTMWDCWRDRSICILFQSFELNSKNEIWGWLSPKIVCVCKCLTTLIEFSTISAYHYLKVNIVH